ncbi:unnamed protein product, partial [Discosporangium mesarthrocarpum]
MANESNFMEGGPGDAAVLNETGLGMSMLVVPSGLAGISALWGVALSAENHQVVDEATQLLNRAHQALAPRIQDRIGEVRAEYIKTCMAHVQGSVEIAMAQSQTSKIQPNDPLPPAMEEGLRAQCPQGRGVGATTVQALPSVVALPLPPPPQSEPCAPCANGRPGDDAPLQLLSPLVGEEADASSDPGPEPEEKGKVHHGTRGEEQEGNGSASEIAATGASPVEQADGGGSLRVERMTLTGRAGGGMGGVVSSAEVHRRIIRALRLLEDLMDETEIMGSGGLRGHGARIRGKVVTLNFENKMVPHTPLPKTFQLELYSNTEVWEVRRRVAVMGNIVVSSVQLVRPGGREVTERENSRTLREINVRGKEEWQINKRPSSMVPRAELLGTHGHLLSRPTAIFTDWFNQFKGPDGYMTREGAAAFINSCCHDDCSPSDSRVNKFFKKYDEDQDGLLSLQDFLHLYRESCREMPEVVWNNLHAHCYLNDLTRQSPHSLQEASGDVSSLPRHVISSDKGYISLLLSTFALGEPSASRVWALLMRLPTNPEILEAVRTLDGVSVGGQSWQEEGE